MFKGLARRMLSSMERRYDYDASYLHHLMDASPKAFRRFMQATALSRHRERVPAAAAFTAQLVATLHEDCGPCTQIVVHLARAAGVPAGQIEAVLTHNSTAMSTEVALAYRYAAAVLERRPDAMEAREAVRAQWSGAGVVDLAAAMLGARLYPTMKAAMGFARSCERIKLDDRWVVPRAAR